MPEYLFLQLEWFIEKRSNEQLGKWKGCGVEDATLMVEKATAEGVYALKALGNLVPTVTPVGFMVPAQLGKTGFAQGPGMPKAFLVCAIHHLYRARWGRQAIF